MGDSRKISFFVNGKATELETDPNVPLLHVLREALGLKATRFGCGEATCGACTVIVDGRPVMSCDMPVGQIDNCRIETADGLAGDTPDPLVAGFNKTWHDGSESSCDSLCYQSGLQLFR